jgi:hypothetical protein
MEGGRFFLRVVLAQEKYSPTLTMRMVRDNTGEWCCSSAFLEQHLDDALKSWLAFHESIQQPPGITVGEVQEMGMVDDSVKERGGDFCVGEDVVPTPKFKVCGDDKRLSFITFRNDLEEQFRSVRIKGDIAPFVANQQIQFLKLFHEHSQTTGRLCLYESVYEVRCAPEPRPVPGITCSHPGCNRHMCLTRANVAVKDKVLAARYKNHLHDVVCRQGFWEFDVLERIFLKGLRDAESGGFDIRVAPLPVAFLKFTGKQFQQKIRMAFRLDFLGSLDDTVAKFQPFAGFNQC